jgi:hypothetical protein
VIAITKPVIFAMPRKRLKIGAFGRWIAYGAAFFLSGVFDGLRAARSSQDDPNGRQCSIRLKNL